MLKFDSISSFILAAICIYYGLRDGVQLLLLALAVLLLVTGLRTFKRAWQSQDKKPPR